MQEPMLTFRRVTKESLLFEASYPSSIVLAACICALILYVYYLYPGSLLRWGNLLLDLFVFIASPVVLVLIAAGLRAILPLPKHPSLVSKFFISPKAEMAHHSLYTTGALALCIVLFCILTLRPAISIAVGSIFSITAFWPQVRYGLQFVKNNIQVVWRMLLGKRYVLELVLVDSQTDPFKQEE